MAATADEALALMQQLLDRIYPLLRDQGLDVVGMTLLQLTKDWVMALDPAERATMLNDHYATVREMVIAENLARYEPRKPSKEH